MKRQTSGRDPSTSVKPYVTASSPVVTERWFHRAQLTGELLHGGGIEVVDHLCDPHAAKAGDELGCLLDRFGTPGVVRHESPRAAAAPGADHRRTSLAQAHGDPAPGAARRTRNHGNVSSQDGHGETLQHDAVKS